MFAFFRVWSLGTNTLDAKKPQLRGRPCLLQAALMPWDSVVRVWGVGFSLGSVCGGLRA